jgi:hypothetical protein
MPAELNKWVSQMCDMSEKRKKKVGSRKKKSERPVKPNIQLW